MAVLNEGTDAKSENHTGVLVVQWLMPNKVLYELLHKGHFRFTSQPTYRPGVACTGKSRIPSITEQCDVLRFNKNLPVMT